MQVVIFFESYIQGCFFSALFSKLLTNIFPLNLKENIVFQFCKKNLITHTVDKDLCSV